MSTVTNFKSLQDYGHLYQLESHVFFYGLKEGETTEIELDEGKIMFGQLVKYETGPKKVNKTLAFESNFGNRREIKILDPIRGRRKNRCSLWA